MSYKLKGITPIFHLPVRENMIYLNKTNFLGIAAEALSATHEPILPDQPMRVPAHTTANITNVLK